MSGTLKITPSNVMDRMDELKAERMRRGYTRQKLSVRTGVSMEMIRQYERGTCLPKQKNYNKLAEFFGWEAWE